MTVLDGWLACPHCAEPLSRGGSAFGCRNRHSFDLARQGYLNLLGRAAPQNADTPAMLDARARFLAAGHYLPIAAAVAEATAGAGRIVEVGAGTGYYLAHCLDAAPTARGLATDVSVAAAKRAARAHPRAGSVVADTWAGLPILDEAADAVVCVFAPRNAAEFGRILAPDGRLVVVVPTSAHLAELRRDYGLLGVDDDKSTALLAAFPGWRPRTTRVEQRLTLTAAEVADLIAMGPNAFHGAPPSTAEASTTLSVDVIELTLA